MEVKSINYYYHKYFKWVICAVCLFIFIHISIELTENELIFLDNKIYYTVAGFISYKMTRIFRFITRFGSGEVILPLWIFTLLLFKNKRKIILSTVNLINIVMINQIFKFLFERPRPTVFRLAEASGFSFPSGHSMVSLAFYGFFLYLLWKTDYTDVLKWIATVAIITLIVLIGVSRIYLGVHFSSDVLAGFSLSMAYLIIFTHFVEKFIYEKNKLST